MAKRSVRKKGKKWYYQFYIEDESATEFKKNSPEQKVKRKRNYFSERQWRITITKNSLQKMRM